MNVVKVYLQYFTKFYVFLPLKTDPEDKIKKTMFSVWVNGQQVGNHSGGHLPFEMVITDHLDFSESNRLTVAVNNTLNSYSIPQGQFVWHNESKLYPAGKTRTQVEIVRTENSLKT